MKVYMHPILSDVVADIVEARVGARVVAMDEWVDPVRAMTHIRLYMKPRDGWLPYLPVNGNCYATVTRSRIFWSVAVPEEEIVAAQQDHILTLLVRLIEGGPW